MANLKSTRKERIAITIDRDLLVFLDSTYSNRSQAIEQAVILLQKQALGQANAEAYQILAKSPEDAEEDAFWGDLGGENFE
ncbi:MAG: hypothetical protein HC890_11580 [Chloroflexaceae bacterium]|nr:hypothetical protein [Chloroflexaceae bacterium]